jgi:hypothetical protein
MKRTFPDGSSFRVLFSTVLLAFLMVGCASDPTTSNVDPTADLSRYNTYAFLMDLAAEKGADYTSLETTFLKKAIARELEALGMKENRANPDILMNFSIDTQEKVQSRSVPTGNVGMGYDPFYDGYYYGGWGATHTTRIDQYTEGRLVIDAIDPVEKKLVWQGTTKGRLTTKAMQNMEATLSGAVNEIFNKFKATESGQ